MPRDHGTPAEELTSRSLTTDDLDERIRGLAGMVAARAGGEEPASRERLEPRWITAAELVRLVRPFLGNN